MSYDGMFGTMDRPIRARLSHVNAFALKVELVFIWHGETGAASFARADLLQPHDLHVFSPPPGILSRRELQHIVSAAASSSHLPLVCALSLLVQLFS